MKENTFITILQDAGEKGIAVGATNIFNYLTADASVRAASELGVNVILQTSSGTVKYYGTKKLFDMIDAIRRQYSVKVGLHLDHCRETDLGKACVDAGWDSVMMDFSRLPFEENIAKTREVVEYAHKRNVAVEGEIGVISGVEEDVSSDRTVKAGYSETVEFIERSGIDAVAPAIGTAHGVYHGEPKLDYDLVEQLGKLKTPVVIHGGTGLSPDQFHKLIRLGGRKVNISTLIKQAYLGEIKEIAGQDLTPLAFDEKVEQAVIAAIKKHLKIFSNLD